MSEIKYRDILSLLLKNYGAVAFDRFDGTLGIVSLDAPASITRNIANSEILVDQSGLAVWNYSYSSTERMITSLELWYQPITPLKDGFGAKKYCRSSSYPSPPEETEKHNFSSEGSTYKGYLDNSRAVLGEERPLTLYARAIRDEATAEALCKLVIKWKCRPLIMMELDCSYAALDIELFDKIGITGDVVPALFQSKSWLVVGHRITPCVGGQKPVVKLKLIELGTTGLPADTAWVEVGAPGNADKVETGTGSTAYTEVG